MLQLTQDELDYFYGAFCDVAGAGPDDNPGERQQFAKETLRNNFSHSSYGFLLINTADDLRRANKPGTTRRLVLQGRVPVQDQGFEERQQRLAG